MPNKPISQHTEAFYASLPAAPNRILMQKSTSESEAHMMNETEATKWLSKSKHRPDYIDTAAMIADQAEQNIGQFFYAGSTYYEYLGTTLGTIADYREVSTGGGSGALEEKLEFSPNLDTIAVTDFVGSLTVNSIPFQSGISSIQIEISLDQGANWTSQASVAALNTYLGLNVTGDASTGTDWMLRISAIFVSTTTTVRFAIINYQR